MALPPLSDPATEAAQIALMAVALFVLLVLGNRLSSYGVFEPTVVTRAAHGPLLLALAPLRTAALGAHPLMRAVLAAARARGVEEETSVLGDDAAAVTRGELVGLYRGDVRPFMRASPAEVGVVLDTGDNRVNAETCAAWQKRFEGKEGLADVRVRIVALPDAMCVPLTWNGRLSECVAQWRALRKLVKHWRRLPAREKKGAANFVMQTLSERRARVLSVIPVDFTKSVYVD